MLEKDWIFFSKIQDLQLPLSCLDSNDVGCKKLSPCKTTARFSICHSTKLAVEKKSPSVVKKFALQNYFRKARLKVCYYIELHHMLLYSTVLYWAQSFIIFFLELMVEFHRIDAIIRTNKCERKTLLDGVVGKGADFITT